MLLECLGKVFSGNRLFRTQRIEDFMEFLYLNKMEVQLTLDGHVLVTGK